MVVSFVLMIWLGIASQAAKSQGYVHNQIKTFSTDNCPIMNSTFGTTEQVQSEETNPYVVDLEPPFKLYFVANFNYIFLTGKRFLCSCVFPTCGIH